MAATEKRAVRERASPAVWRERVEGWKSSGLTAKEFAATENLAAIAVVVAVAIAARG